MLMHRNRHYGEKCTGMGWDEDGCDGDGENLVGDGVGMGRTSCSHEAVYCGVHARSQIALSSLCEIHIL